MVQVIDKKIYKRVKAQIIFLCVVFGFVHVAFAQYVDREIISDGAIVASSLDAVVEATEDQLQPVSVAQNMLSGDRVERFGRITNNGGVDFQYNVSFAKNSGDDTVCDALHLEAKKNSVSVYDAELVDFNLDIDLLNSGMADEWEFVITMPNNQLVDAECDFNFVFIAWQTDFDEPSSGWVDSEEINNNKIHTGLDAPTQTGYNEDNGDPYALPHDPDANELDCLGDITNINGISVHWTDVAHGNSSVKYQRQYNKVGVYNWRGSEIYTNPYTNYRTFGGNPGTEGTYGSRVRAWLDVNDNNIVDTGELVSEWSNECYIEFDRTSPAMPTGLRRLNRDDNSIVYECGDTIQIQHVYPDWDDNTEDDFDHYEYTSFNAPNGAIGLNERVMYDSIFRYNGSWLPHDGTYGFAVRAVDRAGNKSDWALSGKNLAGSCQITYDSSGPELTIDAIVYPNGTVENNKFVTNYNTPVIQGTVTDAFSDVDSVQLTIDGHIYNAIINGNMWEVSVEHELSDGIYEMSVLATDELGNTTQELQNMHIDTIAPNAEHTYYKDGEEIDGFHVYYENGHKFSGPVVYIDSDVSRLGFTGEYVDSDTVEAPSAGLYWDSYAIFEAQDDGSFRFSHDNKRAYCSWRREPNLVDISDNSTFSLTDEKSFADCVATLPEGEYYIAHHIYDYATRKDIPSINQFRDVLGLHFVVDTAPETPMGMRILDHNGNDVGCGGAVNNRSITVDWDDNTEDDFDHYEYQIREETTIARPTVSEYSGRIRDEDGYYKYRVRAVDERGNTSEWTNWCGVTLDRVAPAPPRLIEPVNNSTVDGEELLTDWNPVRDADHYIYESYHDAEATDLRWHEEYVESEKTAHDVADATFWWRVKSVDEAGNESEWSPLWKVTVENDDADESIVLNEFMPDPAIGDEWVEVYNNGDEAVDLAGWFITDDSGPDNHKRIIDSSHTSSGSTIVEANGFLLVENYNSFYLNNDGDTIKLFNDEEELIDSYEYEENEVNEGKTIARSPDGTGDWVDPVPTPGKKNNPSNKKSDFYDYYKDKCFENEKKLCSEEFMNSIGLLTKDKEEKKTERKNKDDDKKITEKSSDNDKQKKDNKNEKDDDSSKSDNSALDLKEQKRDGIKDIIKSEKLDDKKDDAKSIEQQDEKVDEKTTDSKIKEVKKTPIKKESKTEKPEKEKNDETSKIEKKKEDDKKSKEKSDEKKECEAVEKK